MIYLFSIKIASIYLTLSYFTNFILFFNIILLLLIKFLSLNKIQNIVNFIELNIKIKIFKAKFNLFTHKNIQSFDKFTNKS